MRYEMFGRRAAIAVDLCALFVCFAFARPETAALARGESSYRLPEVRETVPSGTTPDRPERWRNRADAPRDGNFTVGMLAIGSGVVAFASDGRMCGFSESSGKRLWCAAAGARPAYSGGVLAYAAGDGPLRALDMRTGGALWSFAFPASPQSLRMAGPDVPAYHVAWAVPGGFLVARPDGASFGERNYGELSTARVLRWSAGLSGAFDAPVFAPPYVFQVVSGIGGGFEATTFAFRLGAGGGSGSSVRHAIDVLSVGDGTMVLRGDQAASVDQPFLSLDVLIAGVADGAVRAQYRYEPDYEDNYRLVRAGALSGSPGKAAVDGDALYFQIASKVYRYTIGPAAGQRPLLVSSEGTLVGGPYLGWLFVARSDGVWALRPQGSVIRARLIASSAAPFRVLAVDGRTLIAAFADGVVRGVDLDRGSQVFSARTCEPARVAVSPKSVYVVCSPPHWRVVSFAR